MRQPRPQVTIRRMMIAVGLAGMVLAVARFIFIDNRPMDILFAAISALEGHSTIYAKGYAESKFRSLHVGMTARQVEDILGAPLERGHWMDTGDTGVGQPVTVGEGTLSDLWYYTVAGKARGSYWRREVWLRNGVVHQLDGTYYLD
jgi:hypothetical protein